MAANTPAARPMWCSSRTGRSWTRCCAGRATATAGSRPRPPRHHRTGRCVRAATRSRWKPLRHLEADARQAQQKRGGILRQTRRRAAPPAARRRPEDRRGTGASLSLHEVSEVRLRSDHRRVARYPDRSMHALPRDVVRRGRGAKRARASGAEHHGARVPRPAAGRLRSEGVRPVMRIAPTPFPGDPAITPQLVREHNLTDPEYERITTLLGRTPTFAELGVFSALWSEHCSYKHSRPVLKTFPTTGAQVVQGPGENAGVLRLPAGWAVARGRLRARLERHPGGGRGVRGPPQGADPDQGGRPRPRQRTAGRGLAHGPRRHPRRRVRLRGADARERAT